MPSYIIAISGPEGVGKDTLISRVLANRPNLQLGRKATTRPPRGDDCNTPTGESKYVYLDTEEFMRQRAAGIIVEHSPNATGALYGSYVVIDQPGVEIRDLDVNGAQQLYAKSQLVEGFPKVILVGILPPSSSAPIGWALGAVDTLSLEAGMEPCSGEVFVSVISVMLGSLERRLIGRGDEPRVIEKKLARAAWEIPEILQVWPKHIFNDDIEKAVYALGRIVDHTFVQSEEPIDSASSQALPSDNS